MKGAALSLIQVLLTYSLKHKMIIHQRDVKAAFLNGELKNEIYMAKPDGFIKEENPDLVWKLKKAIYGLIKAYDQLCQLDREFAGNDK